MGSIFISYRRGDSGGEAGRLFDDLSRSFGENSVFIDIAGIEIGRDFRKVIDENVAQCTALLAIIGKDWVDAKDDKGDRRLDDRSDSVRMEIASALRRDISVVPVLVRGAKMPGPRQLPDDIRELAFRNGIELTHARWNSDLQLLMKALTPHFDARPLHPATGPHAKRKGVATKLLMAVLALSLLVGVGVYLFTAYRRAASSPNSAPKESMAVEIPSVMGKSVEDAQRILSAGGLQIGTIEREAGLDVAPNTVLKEFPAAGEKVKSGSKVDLMVSEARESPTALPHRPQRREPETTDAKKLPPRMEKPAVVRPEAPQTWTVPVAITQFWTHTGVQVSAGQSVVVVARGNMNYNPYQCPPNNCIVGPDGLSHDACVDPYNPVPYLKCVSLMGRIGGGQPFQLGSYTRFAAGSSGELLLGVNDRNPSDNTGSWTATVKLTGAGQ